MSIGVSGYRSIGEGKPPKLSDTGIGVSEYRGNEGKQDSRSCMLIPIQIFLRHTDTPTHRYGTGCLI
jgi:hypothetical protein